MSAVVFDQYGTYYDVLYQDKDYAGEAHYVDTQIRRWAPEARSLLELGSGTGKHAYYLRERGYHTHGVEASATMIEEARRRITEPGVFTHGDISEVRLGRRFDVVLGLFHVVSYLTTDDDLLSTLMGARVHLKEGGVLLFDVWYGPAVLTQRPEERTRTQEDQRVRLIRRCKPTLQVEKHCVDVHYDIEVIEKDSGSVTRFFEDHRMRFFTLEELGARLEACSFELLHAEEWLTAAPPSPDTWGVCITARAR